MPDYYCEGNLIVRTSSYEPEHEPEPEPELTENWKEKLTGNTNKDPTKFKEKDFPALG
jgi:hypothetical protein